MRSFGTRGLRDDQRCFHRPADVSTAESSGDWVPVMRPEDLPKGVRKEVMVDGLSILLFWYR